jgi:RimJ/RimL family protein N-acetyltransferase
MACDTLVQGMEAEVPSLTMVRVSREPFPVYPLQAGFRFRWYETGWEEPWRDIQHRSDKLTNITGETFWKYFGAAPEELPRRQCFLIEPSGAPIGTATAWFDNHYRGQQWGRLHWVAIVPEWQGKGLAKPLLSKVCEAMRELHPERSFLRTAPQRLAAIHLYLKFGYSLAGS